MKDERWLAERFEASRGRLEALAYRMLGSLSDAEDAVQEAWLRVSRADTSGVENMTAWLTTVVARVSLDVLRARKSRGELSLGADGVPEPVVGRDDRTHPEREAALADSVGLAMLVVLERLTPAERVAFVLHDMFDLPFDEIARILGRSSDAARQLASRARRRVRGGGHAAAAGDRARQRDVARAYLDAARRGDLASLLAVLDPDVVLHRDPVLVPGGPTEVRGARTVAGGALAHAERARNAVLALVNGSPGLVLAPFGRLSGALAFTFEGDRIVRMDLVADPERLRGLEIATLDE